MILVADSGSTKCDWILIDESNKYRKTHTMGFNPFFHSSELVRTTLMENELLKEEREHISEIYFYGAGCSSSTRIKIIEDGLRQVFTKAIIVKVDHDLTGAALATSNGEMGITCILGTGSNSCYFDGVKTHEKVPALGYILGDEGSGSYFGKILLSEWLYHRVPSDLADALEKEYNLSKEGIFDAVHHQPNPNVYLASFMPFISKNRTHPYFKEMVYQGLAKFINIHVWCYDNFREVPVNFVGSIAYYFKEVLEEVARNHRFTVGKIEKRPVEPLAAYHFNKKNEPNESESVHL
ncbi:MAG: hypothetical protein COA58_15495 [Bacteroidetes bacterium]|nr:MAG: hypothetical protein COA58_15495 [Bacteroidota bacterium]